MAGVFNALTTAVSGINAQADAFTNLSNNIANSQTVGYKASTTAFADYVSGNMRLNSASQAQSNTVQAVTVQHVDNSGTATKSTNSLAMHVSGAGMFTVSKPSGVSSSASNTTTFQAQQYYTRNGDFYQDKKGYLVNTSGYYLNGYMVDSTGALSNQLSQVNVANIGFKPTTTTTLKMNAEIGKLPAQSTNYTPQSYTSPTTTTYDSSSNPHKIATQWQESSTNPLVWDMSVYDADGTGTIAPNDYQVTFDNSGNLASVVDKSTNQQVGSSTPGSTVSIPISAKYGQNDSQHMNFLLGTIGGKTGTTMVAPNAIPSTTSQAAPLTASGTTLTMGKTLLGTATGSNQSYMTTPMEVNGTQVAAKWTQSSASPPTWTVQAVNPYDSSSSSSVQGATHTVVFNPDGTMKTVDGGDPSAAKTAITASIKGQNYTLDMSGGSLTTSPTLNADTSALTNDSVVSGTYTGPSIQSDGSIMAQFDNGYSQLIGKVSLTNFNNFNGLRAVDGQAYLATSESGTPQTGVVGTNGTGSLAVGYTESSTTDLTGDLSALIVAQEAYTANTKTVTTADQMLQSTIAMKQ
ncbi:MULTISPECIES: flagellar hook-basal body complex protein [unclassified Saccharibacter]|uniref:flagellar hook-basal body complex protein n=1 Tax=unclassified Saccharibacter TaxID=2648722 RepID=UPI001325999D|nr:MULTISPECIES: flagellar hook-basal body complex protein [unclassified Saccharibacter]MXV36027.1 flagellar hook-basal body complex protein [Saccharibacter sp. EH611]MXV56886.1 flagellar hook-basal body complex protein [Saccharibacter sp. EH70]MXV66754.1 flagellar hook-basal body complex protein [Saccharibacter sp. EH60]